ncbi:MAG: manganese efflux pump MntP family protein [Vulcanibacillus sp.]
MNFLTLFIIAIGLSMDAFAVSITSGIVIYNLKLKNAIKIAIFFGLFQAIMPYIGWLLSNNFSKYIIEFDHWVVFIILLFIGLKMIHESRKSDENDVPKLNPLNNKILLTLAFATSVDALAVGVSLSFLDVSIYYAMILIGIVTFIFSLIGVYVGNISGELLKKKAELIGGIILILIGTKILFEHLFN